MTRILTAVFFGALSLSCALGGKVEWTAELRERETEQIELWRKNIALLETMSPDEQMSFLAVGVRNMKHRTLWSDHHPEIDTLYRTIQSKILSIPGHAIYYGNEISRIEDHLIKEAAERGEPTYSNGLDQMWLFQTLEELPSPETLRVLGEMLTDPRGRVARRPDDPFFEPWANQDSLSDRAAKTLSDMIENPPTTGSYDFQHDRVIWERWYEQVKSGRRTVRFKGDRHNYSLDGPVREAKNPDVQRVVKRDVVSPAAEVGQTESGTSRVLVTIIAGLLAIVAAVWLVMKSRRQTGNAS